MSLDQPDRHDRKAGDRISADERREIFARLLSQNERRVYAYILSLVPSWHDADEIAQETNVRLWSEFERFELGTNFTAWAMRVAHFQILTWRKQASRSKLVYSPEIVNLVADAHADFSSTYDARHQALGDCVEGLSNRNRDLIAQYYADGAKVKEIAQGLKRTTESVYKALQRVRLALHKCIQQHIEREGAT